MDGHLNPSRHGVNRRIVLAAAMIPLITRAAVAQTSSGVNPGQLHPKALTFDIQGTTLDFHQPLLQIGQTISAHGGPALDWSKFSAQWLAGAGRIVTEVREGRRGWMSAGAVYQAALDHLTQAGGPAAAAKAQGLMTAYVPRPLENGPGHPVDRAPESYIDVMANDFVDLATKLNA